MGDPKIRTSGILRFSWSESAQTKGNIRRMNVYSQLSFIFVHLRSQTAKNRKKAHFRRFLRPWRHRILLGTSIKIGKYFGNMVRTPKNHSACFWLTNWSFVHRYVHYRGSNFDQNWPKYRIKEKCPKIYSRPAYDIKTRYGSPMVSFYKWNNHFNRLGTALGPIRTSSQNDPRYRTDWLA